ncbi:MAG: hypothetical protein ACE5GI_01345 [Candidatus Aminicenantales bacterium]
MAKPIRATPELRGIDAKDFFEEMVSKEKSKITHKEVSLAEDIKKITKIFSV